LIQVDNFRPIVDHLRKIYKIYFKRKLKDINM
jgi:hypothetical protein